MSGQLLLLFENRDDARDLVQARPAQVVLGHSIVGPEGPQRAQLTPKQLVGARAETIRDHEQ